MFYFPMDFGALTIDGLVDTGALTSAISEADLNKIKLLSNESIKDTGPAPNFQIMVANGQLENPIGTVELQFEVADFEFRERFILMKVLPHPLIGLCFLQKNNAIFDVRQGILTFPYLSMQLKPETSHLPNAPTALVTEKQYTLYPNETLAIVVRMPHLIDHDATGIVQPSHHFDQHEAIFMASSLSTVNNDALTLQLINFTEAPYTITSDTHVADFTVLTPEQIKHIKPVNPTELNFILHQDIEDTDHYLNELLKVPNNEDEETPQYWFPTPENPGDPSKHTLYSNEF